jgi:hypothetical protein
VKELIIEVRTLKNCLKAGLYEKAYECAQNIDDELTTREIKKNRSFKERIKAALQINL